MQLRTVCNLELVAICFGISMVPRYPTIARHSSGDCFSIILDKGSNLFSVEFDVSCLLSSALSFETLAI